MQLRHQTSMQFKAVSIIKSSMSQMSRLCYFYYVSLHTLLHYIQSHFKFSNLQAKYDLILFMYICIQTERSHLCSSVRKYAKTHYLLVSKSVQTIRYMPNKLILSKKQIPLLTLLSASNQNLNTSQHKKLYINYRPRVIHRNIYMEN